MEVLLIFVTSLCKTPSVRHRFGAIALDKCKEVLSSDLYGENETSATDGVEMGIRAVELDQNDQYYVGVGGLPNSNGIMELDAAIMDHKSRLPSNFFGLG